MTKRGTITSDGHDTREKKVENLIKNIREQVAKDMKVRTFFCKATGQCYFILCQVSKRVTMLTYYSSLKREIDLIKNDSCFYYYKLFQFPQSDYCRTRPFELDLSGTLDHPFQYSEEHSPISIYKLNHFRRGGSCPRRES